MRFAAAGHVGNPDCRLNCGFVHDGPEFWHRFFAAGVTIEVSDSEPIDESAVRSTVGALGLGNINVQAIRDFAGANEAIVVFVEQQDAGDVSSDADQTVANEAAQQEAAKKVQDALATLLGDGMEIRKVDVVGPTVSRRTGPEGELLLSFSLSQ